MSSKGARRCIDGTYDLLILLAAIIMLTPLLVVVPIIRLVGAVLESINEVKRRRELTLKGNDNRQTNTRILNVSATNYKEDIPRPRKR